MIEDFINEINELKQYKEKYEWAEKDKQKMSDKLFEYMMNEYNSMSFVERKERHIKLHCRACEYNSYCDHSIITEDIGMPSPSDKAWIPSTKGCKDFEWS